VRQRTDPLSDPEDLLRRTYAYVAYRLGDGPDAEDATSEAFARAVRYRDTFDPGKGRPIDWMIGIARRCVGDAIAARPQWSSETAERTASGDLAADAIQRLELADAIARLTPRDRELVALRYGADLKARQIADQLGMSTNAVEVALHRALGRLREALTDQRSDFRNERAESAPER
jgi:RNA polymerase sigma-70 factor (ECF subfamily)